MGKEELADFLSTTECSTDWIRVFPDQSDAEMRSCPGELNHVQ
jgi:hypothetical protein